MKDEYKCYYCQALMNNNDWNECGGFNMVCIDCVNDPTDDYGYYQRRATKCKKEFPLQQILGENLHIVN
jgi:hypothetical protein